MRYAVVIYCLQIDIDLVAMDVCYLISSETDGRNGAAHTEREKTQLYMQRYMAHFPAAGEVVIFDRSWVQPGWRRAGDGG